MMNKLAVVKYPPFSSAEDPMSGELLTVQRVHRIKARGAARRQIAGEQTSAGEDHGNDQQGRGIPWIDTEEQAAQ
jgi:hypothetical protein